MSEQSKCDLCGEPMPLGEEMFKFHGYSGPCPAPFKMPTEPVVIATPDRLSERWQELFWALPPTGEMRSKLRALEIDIGRMLRAASEVAPAADAVDPQATK